ncbi:anhydro-N-acetylmuramic acid kinase [Aquabacterium fontiphilum]|jgi:anhydro-N-acetylmuramic acid kinase|uniref:anhydro-N-acetylmuramic acid kinase n=1 Tax=Aquabacterium fontiphilum TaxID=450365 RepID=UPI001376CC40|nr:anhydro-N-acetylmuramic acid kinase [Aquabacterium fontiphilum]NBD20583.1 anhydro-N-acetylmuramic acid kinase [Aquabacterium fontiphilum]
MSADTPGELFIGLMSGTSLDGVDGVLVQGEGTRWLTLGHAHRPFPHALRQDLLELNTPGPDELHRSALAAQALVAVYAEVVEALLTSARRPAAAVRAIGAHGQTVRHRPDLAYTWQINHPALLAERTGIDVVADFRSRDIAAGGQGAPLVPAFHQAIFGRPDHTVAVLNVGGMANISILRPDAPPLGFDCGPGNALLDMWCAWQTGHAFDANGEWGAAGEVREDWLADALADPYFALPPPKSTGRDLFNADWLNRWLAPHGLTDGPLGDGDLARDVQATLCELTARSAALAIRDHAPDAAEVVVCGGGALNGDLMRRLSEQLSGVRVGRSDAHGLDVMQVEAAAFAWLAWCHVNRQAGNVPGVTGARGARVLGALYPAG